MKDINELGAWDSLVNELIDSQMYVVAEDATAQEIKSAVAGTNRPRYYPPPLAALAHRPAPVECYSPRSPTSRVVAVPRRDSLEQRVEGKARLEALAARLGLTVTSKVFSTARDWYVECVESTYTQEKTNPPAEAGC